MLFGSKKHRRLLLQCVKDIMGAFLLFFMEYIGSFLAQLGKLWKVGAGSMWAKRGRE